LLVEIETANPLVGAVPATVTVAVVELPPIIVE